MRTEPLPGCGTCKRLGRACYYHAPETQEEHKDSGLCGGKKRRIDGWCKKAAGWGTDHKGIGTCKLHMGSLPVSNTSARRKKAEMELEQATIIYGLDRDVDPKGALLDLIRATAGHVSWLHEKVKSLKEDDDLVWGITKETTGGEAAGLTYESKPSIWLQLYDRERRNLADFCKTAILAGIAERQVEIAEEQGQMIVQVIRGVLEDLGVKESKKVATIVRRNLVLVASGKDVKDVR